MHYCLSSTVVLTVRTTVNISLSVGAFAATNQIWMESPILVAHGALLAHCAVIKFGTNCHRFETEKFVLHYLPKFLMCHRSVCYDANCCYHFFDLDQQTKTMRLPNASSGPF